MENRDEILQMTDSELSACCEFEFFKGSGNGGQKRNKTSSAVRARYRAADLAVTDCSERSQHDNRRNALRKLRMELALRFRVAPAVPPESPVCAMTHERYPLWIAHLLDVLDESGWELRRAAATLGSTPSALGKTVRRDPWLWQRIGDRIKLGDNLENQNLQGVEK